MWPIKEGRASANHIYSHIYVDIATKDLKIKKRSDINGKKKKNLVDFWQFNFFVVAGNNFY